MAIATLDEALAGMQWPRQFNKAATPTLVAGRPWSLWGLAGNPSAGSWDNTLAGVALSSTSAQVNGQINFQDGGTGINTYLARFQGQATNAGTLILADRLWHNGGFTITQTTAQTINSATFPARDANGSTNGVGVLLGLEVSAAAGAAAPTITVEYTNSSNNGTRTATNSFPTANSPAAGSFFPLGLQSGDVGVRSVQSLTLSASWVSGTINLVAYRPLAYLELTASQVPNAIDALTSGFPRLYNGSVPYLIYVSSATTAANVSGTVVWTQG